MGAIRSFLATVVVVPSIILVSCGGGAERHPNVPPSSKVKELRHAVGESARDCGEALESRKETTCGARPVGECLAAALKACRPAYGTRSFFTAEGDAVRVDWLVASDGHDGCHLVLVEDRSADPLASKRPSVQVCHTVAWKPHESIRGCEVPVPDGCLAAKADALESSP
jgi:hypothetical protein